MLFLSRENYQHMALNQQYRKPGKYPGGIADFEDLIQRGCIYVDKTELVYQMTEAKFVFLNRPRRFGKSLLCSTLKCYFEGKKDLFKGLKIMELEKEWKKYPVLHFTMSSLKDKPIDQMSRALGFALSRYEKLYGEQSSEDTTPGVRFAGLLQQAYETTGEKVVVIIDEYDAPMLTNMHDEARKEQVRQILQEFYQTIKDCEEFERFVFITGITKFSQLSIFSTINNLMNISMDERYSSLCGISESELRDVFDIDVQMLADKYGVCKDEMYAKMKSMYDGYHFCEISEDIYNPFSIIRAFYHRKIGPYWFDSGTPTFLINELKKNGADIVSYDGREARATEFDQPTENMKSSIPLMYQAGYLTIKDFDVISGNYTLGIPNSEVKAGLMENILPIVSGTEQAANERYATMITKYLRNGEYDKAMENLQSFLSSIPYMQHGSDNLKDLATLEALYQRDLYIFFSGLSATVQCETMMAEGRTDMVMYLGDKIFIFEFKVRSSAKSALEQIDRHRYYEPWRSTQRTLVKCGARFDVSTRTLKEWKFEEVL